MKPQSKTESPRLNIGRNVVEGVVKQFHQLTRKEGYNTISYFVVVIQTKNGHLKLRLEDQPMQFVNVFRKLDTVVEFDVDMQDSTRVRRLRGAREIADNRASNLRSMIEETDTDKVVTTVQKVNHRVKPLLNHITDPTARAIVERALQRDGYNTYAAALGHHHEYEGGLLRHSVGVAEEALKIVEQVERQDLSFELSAREKQEYNREEGFLKRGTFINKSVVVAGALLHDIGKLQEYRRDPSGTFQTYGEVNSSEYHTSSGQLMIEDIAKQIENPDREVVKNIKNIIASHHVKEEYGARENRRGPESFIVSMADGIDTRASQTDGYIGEQYIREVEAVMSDTEMSVETAQARMDRARQSMESQAESINRPDGGFTPVKKTSLRDKNRKKKRR